MLQNVVPTLTVNDGTDRFRAATSQMCWDPYFKLSTFSQGTRFVDQYDLRASSWDSETAHSVKVSVTKPSDMSPVPGTHIVKGGTNACKLFLDSRSTPWYTPHTNAQHKNK